jgi:pilus assembly protein CpaB
VRSPLVLAIALTLGAMAAFFAARFIGDTRTSGYKVVIVEQPIEAGEAIKADRIKIFDWPGSTVPKGASTQIPDVVGRIALVSMMPGELVLPGKLASKNATGGLSSIIEEGKRAITVQVNEIIAVAGFALPGSYVDVLVSGKDASQQPFSRTVLSRVKILAVAQETAKADKPKVVNAVTLELAPGDVEKLDLSRNIGVLSLVLRNELDTGEINSAGVRLSDIVSSQPARATTSSPVAQAASATRPTAVPLRQSCEPEEIRGTSRQNIAKP